MRRKNTALTVAAVALTICIASVLAIWFIMGHVFVDGRPYDRDAAHLDLRGSKISAEHYEKLRRKLPGCRIQWDIPFQDVYLPQETDEITITSLTDGQVRQLDYLLQLKKVDASGCTDYAALAALKTRRPEVEVVYTVTLNGTEYPQDTRELEISGVPAEEVERLNYLPDLETVKLVSGGNNGTLGAIMELCQERKIAFEVKLGGKTYDAGTTSVVLKNATDGDLSLVRGLPNLKTLHIEDPQAKAENLVALQVAYPQIAISWEMDVCGIRVSSEDAVVDLYCARIPSIQELEKAMLYFPKAEKLALYGCVDPKLEGTIPQDVEGTRPGGVMDMKKATVMDYEELSAYRDRVRDQYKVVWTVPCGKKLTVNTDDTSFMPTREHVYYFLDSESYNLRYCEDMICVDIGHMAVTNVDFAAFMPNLQYLILAHTEVRDLTPLTSCQQLKFLELDHCTVKDFTPLLECKGLQDLNIGETYADIEPITQMTWLKNLWMIGRSGAAFKVVQALPDTNVVYAGNATVASGWRSLENYYAMRDALKMDYMKW